MNKYSQSYIAFAKQRMESQGPEIKQWAKSNNLLLAQVCREILEATGQGESKSWEKKDGKQPLQGEALDLARLP